MTMPVDDLGLTPIDDSGVVHDANCTDACSCGAPCGCCDSDCMALTLTNWPVDRPVGGAGPTDTTWRLRFNGVDGAGKCVYRVSCNVLISYNSVTYTHFNATLTLECGVALRIQTALTSTNPADTIDEDVTLALAEATDCDTVFTYTDDTTEAAATFDPDCIDTCCGWCPDGQPDSFCVTLTRPDSSCPTCVRGPAGDLELTTDFLGTYAIPKLGPIGTKEFPCSYYARVKSPGVLTKYTNTGSPPPPECGGEAVAGYTICLYFFVKVNWDGAGRPCVRMLAEAVNQDNPLDRILIIDTAGPGSECDLNVTDIVTCDQPVVEVVPCNFYGLGNVFAHGFAATYTPVFAGGSCTETSTDDPECNCPDDNAIYRLVRRCGDNEIVKLAMLGTDVDANGLTAFKIDPLSIFALSFPDCYYFVPGDMCLPGIDTNVLSLSDIIQKPSCEACEECPVECVTCVDCEDTCPTEGASFVRANIVVNVGECGTCTDDFFNGCGHCYNCDCNVVTNHDFCAFFALSKPACLAAGHCWWCDPECSDETWNASPCSFYNYSGTIDIPLVSASTDTMHFNVSILSTEVDLIFHCDTLTMDVTVTIAGRCVASGTVDCTDCNGGCGTFAEGFHDNTIDNDCTPLDGAGVELTDMVIHRVKLCV